MELLRARIITADDASLAPIQSTAKKLAELGAGGRELLALHLHAVELLLAGLSGKGVGRLTKHGDELLLAVLAFLIEYRSREQAA